MPEAVTSKKLNTGLIAGVVLVVLVVVVALGLVFSWKAAPKTEGYQAVFLSNGQVYFGKVSKVNRTYVELSDIYYLQLRKPLQAQEPPAEGETEAQSKLTLIKLGNELHGPKDMILNQKHVLFVENLKDDSKVVEAINQHKAQQEAEVEVEVTE